MNSKSIFFAVALGVASLSNIGCVVAPPTTTGGYSDNYESDNSTDYRGKVRRLREHYYRVLSEAERYGAGSQVHAELRDVDDGIHRVASFVFSGSFNPERAQENISRLHAQLRGISEQVRH